MPHIIPEKMKKRTMVDWGLSRKIDQNTETYERLYRGGGGGEVLKHNIFSKKCVWGRGIKNTTFSGKCVCLGGGGYSPSPLLIRP